MIKNTTDIDFADDAVISALEPFVERVLDALCKETYAGVKGAWVSDLSLIGDFSPSEEDSGKYRWDLQSVSRELGVLVKEGDLVVEVAVRLRNKEVQK